MIQGNAELKLPEEWTSSIDAGVKEYCEQMFSTLREHGYSDDYTKLVFLGGGASIVTVSYTHLTLPTSYACISRWSPYH